MTFKPQYNLWSTDDFNSDEGFTYDNPGEFEVTGGTTRLIPVNYNTGSYSYNSELDPVTGWFLENSLDDIDTVTGEFAVFANGSGFYGNIGTFAGQGFLTDTPTVTTGADGSWESGHYACWVDNTIASNGSFTLEFDVRTIPSDTNHALDNGTGMTGVVNHGIFIAATNCFSFIEVHPEGLKVHGVSGAILPGDFTSSMKRVRVAGFNVLTDGDLAIATSDGQTLFVDQAFQDISNGVPTTLMSFGAFPLTGIQDISGHVGGQFPDFTQFYDDQGITGFAAFEGRTIWDNYNAIFNEAVIKHPDAVLTEFPQGLKTMYTAPWYPNAALDQYLGAYVELIPLSGGHTIVTPQVRQPSGLFGEEQFIDIPNADAITIDGPSQQDNVRYIDLSDTPVYQPPFLNQIRFKIEAESVDGAPPEIDTITAIAKSPGYCAKIVPNWKVTSLPQDVFFISDTDKYNDLIPPPHHEDLVYLHNEANRFDIDTDDSVSGFIPSAPSGNVKTIDFIDGAQGLRGIQDGVHGPAFRNFVPIESYSGNFFSQTTQAINEDDIFVGEILDSLGRHPFNDVGQSTVTGGDFTVSFNVEDYTTIAGEMLKVQTVRVSNYTGQVGDVVQDVGLAATGVFIPTGANNVVSVVEGVIEIPKGPGVVVTIHEVEQKHQYFLEGNNYREPTKFGVATVFTGAHTTNAQQEDTYVSLGVRPRQSNTTGTLDPEFGDWITAIENNADDEFILYSLTGYTADHVFVQYDNISGNAIRQPAHLDPDVFSTSDDYRPVHRDSFLLEGWFRPFGLTEGIESDTAMLAEVYHGSPHTAAIEVRLDRSGQVTANFNAGVHKASYGEETDDVENIGPDTNGWVTTGNTNMFSLSSSLNRIAWGAWNHIGLVLESRAIGDTTWAANQPQLPNYTGNLLHGARSSMVYLSVNSEIVDAVDISPNNYAGRTGEADANTVDAWPPLVRDAFNSTDKSVLIGSGVVCDFDHVRYGVRSTADALTTLNTFGYKDTPPQFVPFDAPKPSDPVSGGVSHQEFAHIYRFDRPNQYVGWDDGFAPSHLIFEMHTGHSLLDSYGIRSDDFLQVVDGPHGRPALRIGPGANAYVPWSAFDERTFNGTGCFEFNDNSTSSLYSSSGALLWPDRVGYEYERRTANGHWRFHTKIMFNTLPANDSHANAIADFITLDDSSDMAEYGLGQAYFGIDQDGFINWGTRYNYNSAASASERVGPFSSVAQLTTGVWYDIGGDIFLSDLDDKQPFMNLYVSGQLDTEKTLTIGPGGGIASTQGRAMGFLGALNDNEYKSRWRIGGDIPRENRASAIGNWEYFHSDISVQDFVIGYSFDDMDVSENHRDISYWDFARLAGTGLYTGHTDVAVVNNTGVVGPVYGTGQMPNVFFTGVVEYPATPFSDAGQKLLFSTANGGNDFEGLAMFGLPLFGDGTFVNAESYYAVYENDNASEVLGTTDSPIQIGGSVPRDSVNLALVTTKEWSTPAASTTFDLSDDNYANVTNKLQGDFTTQDNLSASGLSGIIGLGIDSDEVRLSSTALWDGQAATQNIGYFMHLVGGEDKGVYVPNAIPQSGISTGEYFTNLNKIKEAITINDRDGNPIPWETFPYDIIATPYGPDSADQIESVLDEVFIPTTGGFHGDIANEEGVFTVLVVAGPQSIGQSVFIHYPSKTYDGEDINLMDKEVYNPVPLMREQLVHSVFLADGTFNGQTGYFSVIPRHDLRDYFVTIWHADIEGWDDKA